MSLKKETVFQKLEKYRGKFLLPVLLTRHCGNGNSFWSAIWPKTQNFPLSPLRWPHFLWKAVDKKLSSDSAQGTGPLLSRSCGNQDSPQNASLVSTLTRKRERSSETARQMLHDILSMWFTYFHQSLSDSVAVFSCNCQGCFCIGRLSRYHFLVSFLFLSSSSHDHTDATMD